MDGPHRKPRVGIGASSYKVLLRCEIYSIRTLMFHVPPHLMVSCVAQLMDSDDNQAVDMVEFLELGELLLIQVNVIIINV